MLSMRSSDRAARPAGAGRSRMLRAAGLICGLAIVAAGVHSWAIASTGAALGADVAITAIAPGELQITPSGYALSATAMHPGQAPARGTVRLRNITGRTLHVRFRALPSTRELDGALRLTMAARGRRLHGGTADTLRGWSTRRLSIAVGDSVALELTAAIGRAAPGLIADVALEFDARTVGR